MVGVIYYLSCIFFADRSGSVAGHLANNRRKLTMKRHLRLSLEFVWGTFLGWSYSWDSVGTSIQESVVDGSSAEDRRGGMLASVAREAKGEGSLE